MYQAFFDLRELPFELSADPRYLLLTTRHRHAATMLHDALDRRGGITLLLGEPGMGKTSLLTAMIPGRRAAGHCIALIDNPALTRAELFEELGRLVGLTEGPLTKPRVLAAMSALARRTVAAGRTLAIVIDEAQSLSDGLLEELRLLSNIPIGPRTALPVVLAGQAEFADRLNQPAFAALKQRIVRRYRLEPLTLAETAAYVSGRIAIAGGDAGTVFTADGIKAVHAAAGGIPRLINTICDNTLRQACLRRVRPAERRHVSEALRLMELDRPDPARFAHAEAHGLAPAQVWGTPALVTKD